MLAAVGAFAVMDTLLKVLAARYPAAEVTGLRGLASLPFVLGLYAWRGELAKVRMNSPGLHLLRGLIAIALMMTFVYAVSKQSLTGVYAIFMIAPVMVVALAAILLGEKVDGGSWFAVLLGLAGVWIMLRPTSADFATGASLAALASAVAYALAVLTARHLTRTDTSESMIVSFLVMVSIGGLAFAWRDWVPVQNRDWLLLIAIGGMGAVAQHCITDAFRYASAATLAPMEYTALLYGLAIDFVVWSTVPSPVVLLGGLLVVAAGLFVVRRAAR